MSGGTRAGGRRFVADVKYTRVHVFLSIINPATFGEFFRGFWRGLEEERRGLFCAGDDAASVA